MASVEQMMRCFLEADKDKSGFLSEKELTDYAKVKKVPDADIKGFMARFDSNKDGKISIGEFARGLGVNVEEMKVMQTHFIAEVNGEVEQCDETVKIIDSKMPTVMMKKTTDEFRRRVDEKQEMHLIATELRGFLEKDYGKVWQVVVVEGSYAMSFVHEPFNSIQCEHEGKILLAWRTPAGK